MSRVWALASINMDTFLTVEHIVRQGETIPASGVRRSPGGKGLNQSVAAARMGAETLVLGCVGTDSAADELLRALQDEPQLDVGHVQSVEAPSGSTMIQIDATGDNAIVYLPGANHAVSPAMVEQHLKDLEPGDVVMCQLEIPVDAVAAALAAGRAAGATTILNTAPAAPVADLLEHVDVLIANETEAKMLLKEDVADASTLHGRFDVDVIVTLGARGCHVVTDTVDEMIPAVETDVVDTTGAGDAFVGAVAAGLAEGKPLVEAARLGTALASFACRAEGAQGYGERRENVDGLIGQTA